MRSRRPPSRGVEISLGRSGKPPLVGDFDGDGKGDFGTFTDGRWLLSRSENNYTSGLLVDWGTAGDKAVPGDYDGDVKTILPSTVHPPAPDISRIVRLGTALHLLFKLLQRSEKSWQRLSFPEKLKEVKLPDRST